jgi:hypothetical protein
VESRVFASSCSENADCSSIDAILPAVVDHTGVAIKLTPYKGYLFAINYDYSEYVSSVQDVVLDFHARSYHVHAVWHPPSV